jgi:glucoamylase
MLIERFVAGDKSLKQKIDDYTSAQAQLQGVTNPSGGPDTGGLGEPKYNVDKTAFTGPWGRPQRDGPALRATALTIYANYLVANEGSDQAANTVWPVIAKDLAYVVRYWNQTGFDLWEETNGSSFFTLSASHRALVEGIALATKLGKTCDGCAAAAPEILCFVQSFWTGNFIDSNINVNDGRTGKDANSLISSIHTFDPESNCTDATFQPCSSRALANHKAVTDSFRSVYAINEGIAQGQAVAVGRYSEDVYYVSRSKRIAYWRKR